jgi:hypothetical protein
VALRVWRTVDPKMVPLLYWGQVSRVIVIGTIQFRAGVLGARKVCVRSII